MAIIYDAQLSPSKDEIVHGWIRRQHWFAGKGADRLRNVAAYRFDDPDGEVGMEAHLVKDTLGNLYHVPLTYRPGPLDDADAYFITEMEHSVLGTRWVYDASGDPTYLQTLKRVLSGKQAQADEFLDQEAPENEIEKTFLVELERAGSSVNLASGDLHYLASCIDHTPDRTAGGVSGLIGHFPNSDQRFVLIRTSNPR